LTWVLDTLVADTDLLPAAAAYCRMESVLDPSKDWVVHVQRSWLPISIPRTPWVLRFPWHTDADVAGVVVLDEKEGIDKDEKIQLKLQGGVAFGTGEHATTQLCLDWIHSAVQKVVAKTNDTVTVLDYGCGSGVLGLAACSLSRQVIATGIDIDVDACRISNANAVTNNLPMTSFLPPLPTNKESDDDESKSLLLKAHQYATQQLSERGEKGDDLIWKNESKERFDLCVANILAAPLIALAPTLARMVKPGGLLGMSGILPTQGGEICTAYEAAGFDNCTVDQELNGWILVTAVRRANDGPGKA
jgi:ribosomal protein L11 methyltransferase